MEYTERAHINMGRICKPKVLARAADGSMGEADGKNVHIKRKRVTDEVFWQEVVQAPYHTVISQ